MGTTVVVAETENAAQAQLLRQALAAEGIPAHIDNEAVATTLGHLQAGLGGVKVVVAADVAEAALRVIGDVRAEWATGDVFSGEWRCPACGEEVPDGHDVCWSCGAYRDDAPSVPPPPPPPLAPRPSASDAGLHASIGGRSARSKAEVVNRAWRMMWAALVIPFVPSVLSLATLAGLPEATGSIEGGTRWRLGAVIVGNALFLYGTATLASFFVRNVLG